MMKMKMCGMMKKKEYNYDALEKAFNKYIPGFIKFLIDNQVGAIRNYW